MITKNKVNLITGGLVLGSHLIDLLIKKESYLYRQLFYNGEI